VIVGASFGGAIHATGSLDRYLAAVQGHSEYIAKVDSWRSEVRPALWRLVDRFFVKQYQWTPLSFLATLFVLAAAAGSMRERSRPMLRNVLTFGPFAIVAWLMLDRYSISRFSIGYQPMFAVLVADGIRRVAGWRVPEERVRVREAVIVAVLVVSFAAWALPAFSVVRSEISPSLQAARAAAERIDPKREHLYVGHTMSVFVDLVAPGLPYTRVIDDRALPIGADRPAWLLAEITKTPREGIVFARNHDALWQIARRHYFDVKLAPLTKRAQFGEGWYEAESDGIFEWRWMAGRGVVTLPPAAGRSRLRMHLGIPGELVAARANVTLRLNGTVVDTFEADEAELERNYNVDPAPGGAPNTMELTISNTVTAPHDPRPLGLRLRYFGWGPA
jgi:hypothetical protein